MKIQHKHFIVCLIFLCLLISITAVSADDSNLNDVVSSSEISVDDSNLNDVDSSSEISIDDEVSAVDSSPELTASDSDLNTVAKGDVSGDVDVKTSNPWATSGELSYEIPTDVENVDYAGLFVNVYSGSAAPTYGAESNISMTSGGETNQIASERLVSTEGSTDGTVYVINDHITKCYSDYHMIYNITDQLQGKTGTVTFNVINTAIDGYNFDGKIKLIGLVFAYNDGDNDKVSYWVNSGQSWTDYGTTKSTFDVGTIKNEITEATIDNIALSSSDGLYSFNSNDLDESIDYETGSFYKYHKWNVLNKVLNGTNTLVYTPGSGSLKNVLSVLKLKSSYSISVNPTLNTEYTSGGGACYAGTNNTLKLTLNNNGDLNSVYTVDFYVDGNKVNSYEIEVAVGENGILYMTDDTIRPVTEATVKGADNAKVNYTAIISDKDNGVVLNETSVVVPVLYNGNLGKDFAYPAENMTSFKNITVNGGVIIDTKEASTYMGATDLERTDVWALDLAADADLINAYLYVAYNWDKTSGDLPVWTCTFNNVAISPVAYYRDCSNLGTYARYGYGLIVYDVSSLVNKNGDNTFVLNKEFNMTAVYPSTFVAFYNVADSDTITTVYMYNGADLLTNSYNLAGRTAAANSVLDINSIEGLLSAKLHVFAASAQSGEGNLIVNGETYSNVWTGTTNTTDEYIIDLGSHLSESNTVSFVATGSTILALEQFVVIESHVLTDIYVSPDGTGTGASADDPTNLVNALNISAPYTKIHVLDGTYAITSNDQYKVKVNNTYIVAENPGNAIFDGDDANRAFRLSGVNVTLDGLTLVHGKGVGGHIYIESDAKGSNILNCIFRDYNHTSNGGAVYIFASNAYVSNCKFINCTSTGNTGGGAIYVNTAHNVTITDCEFTDCYSARLGGAIRFFKSENSTVLNSNFTNCIAVSGGAVVINGTNGLIQNCTFINNKNIENASADHYGGAVLMTGNYGLINNCTFINSTSTGTRSNNGGGAVFWGQTGSASNNGTVMNCIFINNTAAKDGGAVCWFSYGEGRLINCAFDGNKAEGFGGAIYWRGDKSHILDSNFTNNYAKEKGGAVCVGYSVNNYLDLANCNFENNSAESLNYTIHNDGVLLLENNVIGAVYAIYNNKTINSTIYLAFILNETDLDSNIRYADVGDVVDILIGIYDDNFNLINGGNLTLVINDTNITEFSNEDGYYKASYTVPDYGLYNVNGTYTNSENVLVKEGKILTGDPVPSVYIELGTEYADVCYAATNNSVVVYLKNDGGLDTTYVVEFYVDGNKVNTTEVKIPIGNDYYYNVIDNKIRPATANTVYGKENDVANYTVIVYDKDTGEILGQHTILPSILYNGYFGKDLSYPGENYTLFNNITVNGGVLIAIKDNSTYLGNNTVGRTDQWELELPSDAILVNGFIFVAYNWDSSEGGNPVWETSFNEQSIAPVASFRDQANMGKYAERGYGLVVYDVTGLVQNGYNKFSLGKTSGLTAVYPSTLVVLYNVTESDTIKNVYMFNGADLLSNANNTAGRTVASNSVLNIDLPAAFENAKLYVFASSAQIGEGDLTINGQANTDIWDGGSQSTDVCIFDISSNLKASNEVSFIATGSTILALQQFIVVERSISAINATIAPEYTSGGGACYAGTNNTLTVNLTNNGVADATCIVDFYVDGVKVDSSEIALAVDEKTTIFFTDETIRPITEATVNGADNAKVNYTIIVSDKNSGAILTESTILPSVWYNGYLGKDYAYPNGTIESFNNITVNGGIIIDTKDNSTVAGGASTGRTDVWTLELADDATIVNGFLYVPYNWDKTDGAFPVWTTTFNGASISPIASYRDQSNLGGASSRYGYGLIVYDVSSLIQKGENTFVLEKISNLTAVYPSTLIALYNVTESDTLTTVYMFNGADLLANSYNIAGRTAASNSVLDIELPNLVESAELHIFAAGAQAGEGNLIINGGEPIINVWDDSTNSVSDYVVDMTNSIAKTNTVSFVATGSTILALQQFIVVKSPAPKTSADLQKLIDETPAGGTLNLSNVEFDDVSNINITKDITIVGDNLIINTAGDDNPVFNIDSNVNKVSISGVEFVANSGDVLVKAATKNGTDDLSIVNPAIELKNNTVTPANDDVVVKTITLFELEAERAVLAPSNPITIQDNNVPNGVKSFEFEIAGLNNGSGINIPQGGSIKPSGDKTVKVATKITSKKLVTTTVYKKLDGKKAGKNFSITLKDAKGKVLAGKQVIIFFNGKVYKRTTNKKGVATLKIAVAKKGNYVALVSFLGDDNYKSSFITAKIKVNPQKVKIKVPKKKFKAKKKTKVLTATLKNSKGKAIKGKKLTFIVNKKKYTAKTNKKGIAKVKVKLSKKKTYKVTVKFAGDNTYKKLTKKGKVVIK